MRKILGIALGALVLNWTAPALASGTLDVEDPYVLAVPPGQSNSVAFMRIVNRGPEERVVLSSRSGVAGVVELHRHTMEDGMMKMRRIDRIEIPAKGVLSLEPGGLHLMLIGLTRDLAPGDTVLLRLNLDDGTDLEVLAPVRAAEPVDRHHH